MDGLLVSCIMLDYGILGRTSVFFCYILVFVVCINFKCVVGDNGSDLRDRLV